MDLRERRLLATESAPRHPWELARLEVVNHLLSRRGPQPRVVLDIGCGDAFVAEQLSRRHPHMQLVAVDTELQDDVLAALRQRVADRPIRFVRSLEEAAQAGLPAADLVLLLDVIEHIQDEIGFLRELQASPLITPQTQLLITVPSYQRLFCSHDVFLGHCRRYDGALLREHLQQAGYRVVEQGAFFLSLLAPRCLQVWRERGKPPATAVGLAGWNGGPLLTAAVRSALLADFACTNLLRRVGVRLPGLSQYALCTPSAL